MHQAMAELQVAQVVDDYKQYPELQVKQAFAVQLHVKHYGIFEQTKHEMEDAKQQPELQIKQVFAL